MTNTRDMNGNITTDSIRNLYDLGAAYADMFAGTDAEYVDGFRGGDEIDCEALAQDMLDNAVTAIDAFEDDGFTWYRDGFDTAGWAVIEAAYPVA